MNVEAQAQIEKAARDLAQATGEKVTVWKFADDHRETVSGAVDLSSHGGVKVYEVTPDSNAEMFRAALARPRMF